MSKTRIKRLRKLRAQEVLLWSLHPIEIWEKLQTEGHLYSYSPPISPEYKYWPHAYRWMRGQMASRLTHYSGHYPWWAWVKPKPDLRYWRFLAGETGETMVRLELAIDPSRVLIFDGSAWDMVLNGWYLDLTDEEFSLWEQKLDCAGVRGDWPLPEPFRSELEWSWERIFDLQLLKAFDKAGYETQAVFEKLELNDVISVQEFICS